MPALGNRVRAARSAATLRHATDDDLVRELYPDVETIARSVLGPHDDHLVLTATHDALLAIRRARHGFRGDAAASTWLYTIARREALRAGKRDRRSRHVEVLVDEEVYARIVETLHEDPVALGMIVALEELEEAVVNADWRRIWLLYNEPEARRGHAEVAAMCGRTEGTVAVTLSRVRGLLQIA